MYQYSLDSFTKFFFRAFEKTEQFEEDEKRVLALREEIRLTIYTWVANGLFERHKAILQTSITFRLMQKKVLSFPWTKDEMNFLIYCPFKVEQNPLPEWMPDLAW